MAIRTSLPEGRPKNRPRKREIEGIRLEKMKRFEFLDIAPADAAFVAYGKKLNETFANAAIATFEVMVDTNGVRPAKKKKLEVRGHDLKSLMFNWLAELLFLFGSENMVFSKFDVKIDKDAFVLNATCGGEKIDAKRHELRTEVKAVTYHKMEIKKVGNVWQAQVILDL